jgi:hypothetical protein
LRRKRIDLIDQSIPIIEADRNNREDNGSNSGASRAGEGSTPRFTLQGEIPADSPGGIAPGA